MRIFVAAIFAIVGVPLLLSAVSTLAASPSIDQQTVAMMQVIAGLLCFLISVVASVMRPAERVSADEPRPAARQLAPQAATQPAGTAATLWARDGLGTGVLVVLLAIMLIVLAMWLRKPGSGKDARSPAPVPASGSATAPPRPTAPAVLPAGGTTMKAHAPSRSRRASD